MNNTWPSAISNKKYPKTVLVIACLILVPAAVVLLVIIAVVAIFILSNFIRSAPNQQAVLERHIHGYEYFISGSEVVEYKYQYMGLGDFIANAKIMIPLEKIPKLLETSILKECEQEDFECSSPVWQRKVSGESEKYCMAAEDSQVPESKRTDACIYTRTGEFTIEITRL